MTNWNNKVLYTGVTNNVVKRAIQHKEKLLEGFTKKYNVNKLVYFQEFTYVIDAISSEKKIKGWKREKKVKLIELKNPTWKDLFPELLEYSITLGIGKDPSLHSG